MRMAHEIARLRAVAAGLCWLVATLGCTSKSPPMMVTPAVYSSTTADLDNITGEGPGVPKVESAMKAAAHGYSRSSPWVSSDIPPVLALQLNPSERWLYRQDSAPIRRFPDNYPEQVTTLVSQLKRDNPKPSE